jgi:hypothetical protein
MVMAVFGNKMLSWLNFPVLSIICIPFINFLFIRGSGAYTGYKIPKNKLGGY